jgi:hypothetical protein
MPLRDIFAGFRFTHHPHVAPYVVVIVEAWEPPIIEIRHLRTAEYGYCYAVVVRGASRFAHATSTPPHPPSLAELRFPTRRDLPPATQEP